jgi:hypothetical protein
MDKSYEPITIDFSKREARLPLKDVVYYITCEGWSQAITFRITECRAGANVEIGPLSMLEVWRHPTINSRAKWLCKGLEGIRQDWI